MEGLGERDTAKFVPFVVSQQKQSLDEYRDRLAELKAKRQQAVRGGMRFDREQEYARMTTVSHAIDDLQKNYNRAASADDKRRLRDRQIALARRALAR